MSAFAPEDSDNDYSYAEVDPAETSTPSIPQSMGDTDASHGRGHSNNPLLGSDNPLVSDLEQEVLEEYARLLRNVNQVCVQKLVGLDLFFLGQSRFFTGRGYKQSPYWILKMGYGYLLYWLLITVSHTALRQTRRPRRFPRLHAPRWSSSP